MKEWEVIFTDEAETDLNDIYVYISIMLMEPEIAGKLTSRIFKASYTLNQMPERHPLLDIEPWCTKGVRLFPIDNYILLYHTDSFKNRVYIDHIFYGGRDLSKFI
jgi:toxin ParE1/3/4